MIRKVAIVVLTLGALTLPLIAWMTIVRQVVWHKDTTNSVWAVGAVGGYAFVFHASSTDQRNLRSTSAYWKRYEFGARFFQTHRAFAWKRRVERWLGVLITIDEVFIPLGLPFVLLATYPTIAFIRGPLRRWRRRRRGLCVNCAYDLTGNVTGVCSECGTKIESP